MQKSQQSKSQKTSVNSAELRVVLTLGIDEAGRGPVLGPLVMAGVVLTDEASQQLGKLGVKDSKLLTAEKRSMLYGSILAEAYTHKVVILDPAAIDAALTSAQLNLNWLEARTTADIINELKPLKAIVDCPSPNIAAYHRYMKKLLVHDVELVLEHKAEKHMPVAAASVVAKVTRDRIIEELKKKIGIDFGSGYMTDSLTQEFLKTNYDKHHGLFRKKWASYREVIDKKEQRTLF